MPYRRTTLSKFIIDDQRRSGSADPDLTSLLNDVQTACKLIAVAASRGGLQPAGQAPEGSRPLSETANTIMLATCEWGGQLAGMVSGEMANPYLIPPPHPRGRYLLAFDPLDGVSNIDVNAPVGTVFSILRCPPDIMHPSAQDFLQPGTDQVAAGYAIYGPVAMLVITLGAGVHGFTLDREIGAFALTHPNMAIPAATREFAIDVSNERFWEPPVRRYVNECIDGADGPRNAAFRMRWIASMVAEVHRILLRGGLFMVPRTTTRSANSGGLPLLYDANPMAMIVEQAGGAASTGRARLLGVVPDGIHQDIPVILGSREEVARLEHYYAEHARGEGPAFKTPLFNARTLFRTA